MGLLEGKNALVFGVANDHSIAWGIAQALHEQGAMIGFSSIDSLIDKRVRPQRPDLVARAIKPDYAIGSHMGSLGLAFSDGKALGPAYADGAVIGQHGSWNRSVQHGYRVIFVPFRGGKPAGMPRVVLSGFLLPDGRTHGRPVGVVVDGRGGLLVADDQGNSVWRVAAAKPPPPRA